MASQHKLDKFGFSVPITVVRISKLSSSERTNLALQLKSELVDIQNLRKKLELVPPSNEIRENFKHSAEFREKSSFLGQKPRGWNRGTSGRFESVRKAPENAIILKKCESLLRKFMTVKGSEWFNEPVDVVKLNIPDYFTIIKQPMDFGTIKKKLTSGLYLTPMDFLADMRLTFSNAMTYNPPGNMVHSVADNLSRTFEARWKPIQKMVQENTALHEEFEMPKTVSSSKSFEARWKPIQNMAQVNIAKSAEETPALHEEFEMPSKKRKCSLIHQTTTMAEPQKCSKMLHEEKQKLTRDLESSLGDLPDNITEFLKETSVGGAEVGEDEIEIDLDAMSNDTLLKLRKLLDEFFQKKQSDNAKAEPCEIELQNVSGFSNSSMQLDRGNEIAAEEDVDIGNEPPVSSYPAVIIERDIGEERNDCVNVGGGPSSNSESDCRLGNHEQGSQQKPNSSDSEGQEDGESTQNGKHVSPNKLYRAALLKNRFADTILKAQEKTLGQGEKGDPKKARHAREELEMQRKKEKARLQAEAKAAEEEAAAEAKRKREAEREAARQALLKMEKTVEINENSRFLEDLEMLSGGHAEQLLSSADETSPEHLQDGLGSFKFGGNNPLEQLGLFMKADDDEEFEALPNDQHSLEEGETE